MSCGDADDGPGPSRPAARCGEWVTRTTGSARSAVNYRDVIRRCVMRGPPRWAECGHAITDCDRCHCPARPPGPPPRPAYRDGESANLRVVDEDTGGERPRRSAARATAPTAPEARASAAGVVPAAAPPARHDPIPTPLRVASEVSGRLLVVAAALGLLIYLVILLRIVVIPVAMTSSRALTSDAMRRGVGIVPARGAGCGSGRRAGSSGASTSVGRSAGSTALSRAGAAGVASGPLHSGG